VRVGGLRHGKPNVLEQIGDDGRNEGMKTVEIA
jgi:hypothetical protein